MASLGQRILTETEPVEQDNNGRSRDRQCCHFSNLVAHATAVFRAAKMMALKAVQRSLGPEVAIPGRAAAQGLWRLTGTLGGPTCVGSALVRILANPLITPGSCCQILLAPRSVRGREGLLARAAALRSGPGADAGADACNFRIARDPRIVSVQNCRAEVAPLLCSQKVTGLHKEISMMGIWDLFAILKLPHDERRMNANRSRKLENGLATVVGFRTPDKTLHLVVGN